MRHRLLELIGVAAAVGGMLAALAGASAETCTLELKRLGPVDRSQPYTTPAQYMYRMTYPQHFYMQTGIERPRALGGGETAEFSKVIKKEPGKYVAKYPFRGVMKLGTEQYGFVLDAIPLKTEEKEKKSEKDEKEAKAAEKKSLLKELSEALQPGAAGPAAAQQPDAMAYSRLYFDFNHNGDLTDDKAVDVEQPKGGLLRGYPQGYWRGEFPRIDVTVDVDGTKVDYSFLLTVYSQSSKDYSYVSASLNAAAYREGDITLDGKKRHLVLIDFNSNGRFDDELKIRDDVQTPDGQLYPTYGDVLLVDPDPKNAEFSGYDLTASGNRHSVSKLVNLDGKYYDLKVTPAGDKLTLTPSSLAVGHVTNPCESFRALVYSDKGLLKISGGKSKPAALPEGEWKLLSYTIEDTGTEEPKPKPETPPAGKKDAKQKERTLIQALAEAIVGSAEPAVPAMSGPRFSVVSAQATKAYKAVKVRKGETATLPFGPPYKPVVKVRYFSGSEARLEMSLVGSAGEICSNLTVRGSRPDSPDFSIVNPKGDVVEQGKFKYG
jgi:hypothetical protein